MPLNEDGLEIVDAPATNADGLELVDQAPPLDTSAVKLPPQAPPYMSQYGPATPEDVAQSYKILQSPLAIAGKAAEVVTDTASELASDWLRRTGINPSAQPGVPQFNIPKLPIFDIVPGLVPGPVKMLFPKYAAGAEEELGRQASGFTEPGQAAMLPFTGFPFKAPGLGTVFGAQAVAQLPESIRALTEAKTPQEFGAASASAAANVAIGEGVRRSYLKGDYASRIREAAKVHGDLRAQPLGREGEVPVQEGGAGIQPQAPQAGEGGQARVLLNPEDQAYLDNERKGMETPVEVTETLPEGQPFAHQVSTIDRKTGKILINPKEFSRWLREDVPADRRALAVRSLLDEERIHLAVDDESALNYQKSLSGIEKAINRFRYTGLWEGYQRLTPTDYGHEALRFRLQQLSRMTPREIAEASFADRWGIKAVTALESVVRKIRETLGTKASGTQAAILERMQENLAAAKTAAGGRPGAVIKGKDVDPKDYTDNDIQLSVFKFGVPGIPDGIQADSVKGGVNEFSSNPDALKAAGFDIPSTQELLRALPQGKYTLSEARKILQDPTRLRMLQRHSDDLRRAMTRQPEDAAGIDTPEDFKRAILKEAENDERARQLMPELQRYLAGKIKNRPKTPEEKMAAQIAITISADKLGIQLTDPGELGGPPKIQPGAVRKGVKEPPQAELFLPPAPKGEAQPRPGFSELVSGPTTTHTFELGAYSHLQETTDNMVEALRENPAAKPKAPSFDSFSAYMKGRFGDVSKGALVDAWHRAVWRRLQNASGEALDALRQSLNLRAKVGDRPIADAPREPSSERLELAGETNKEQRALDREGKKRQLAAQRYRGTVTSAIAQSLMEEAQKSFRSFDRKTVTPEDIGFDRTSSQKAWVPLTTEDVNHPDTLGRLLTEDAREMGLPVSITRRLALLQDRATGKAYLVSAYRDGRRGPVLLDPRSPGKTHSPLADILKAYRPVYSILLDEPVKDFHQGFDSLSEFEDKFGQHARAAAATAYAEPEGTDVELGAHPRTTGHIAIPGQFIEKPGTFESREPITDAEAGAVLDHTFSETGTIESPEDIKASWQSLSETTNRQALSGFRKLAQAIERDHPDWGNNEILDALAREIYENHKQAKDFQGFVQRTVEQGSAKARQAAGPAAKVEPETGARELTMRERRPPTSVLPENVPPGTIPAKTGAPPVPEGSLERGTGSRPAALAKRREELKATITRGSIKSDMGRLMDGWMNDAGRSANNAFENIVLASGEKLLTTGTLERLKEKVGQRKQARQNREVAKVMVALSQRDPLGTVNFDQNKVFNPKSAHHGLDQLEHWTDVGIAKAQNLIARNNPLDKLKGNAWLKAAQRLKEEVQYVRAHWGDAKMEETAKAVIDELHKTLIFEQMGGLNTTTRESYFPGRYEGEFFNDDAVEFGEQQMLGRQYGKPKRFQNYYEAISQGPYIPKSYDAGEVAGHRVGQGHRRIARDSWLNSWKSVNDPHTGKPVAVEPVPVFEIDPATGKLKIDPATGQPIFKQWAEPDAEHENVSLAPGMKPVSFRKGYSRLAKVLADPHNPIEDNPIGHAALHLTSMLKHGWILMLDSYHAGRLAQYSIAANGRKWWDVRTGHNAGYSALHYDPSQLQKAVEQGYISQAAADWAKGSIQINVGGQVLNMPRWRVARLLTKKGLNAAKFTDALYKDAVSHIPFAGNLLSHYNKWLFDRYVPGLITETAVHNLERLSASHPNLPFKNIIKSVVQDTNVIYGNLGRQGIFKNPAWRGMAQIFMLAPMWREGLIQKEVRMGSRIVRAPFYYGGKMTGSEWMKKVGGRDAMPYWGPLGREMSRGLLSYAVLTQLINLATRGKPTWKNDEPGHQWDAFVPTDKDTGFWISPLSTFAEVMHSFMKIGGTKERAWDAATGLFATALGPTGRMAGVLMSGRSPSGQYLTSTPRILGTAAAQMAPTPLSLSLPARAIGHKLAPGLIGPLRPGEGAQRALSSLGLKTDVAQDPIAMTETLERKFAAQNRPPTGMHFEPTDEPTYAKLRGALRVDDKAGAYQVMRALRAQGKSDDQILKAMERWANKNFSWSNDAEMAFQQSLSPGEREIYADAFYQKQIQYQKFLELLAEEKR